MSISYASIDLPVRSLIPARYIWRLSRFVYLRDDICESGATIYIAVKRHWFPIGKKEIKRIFCLDASDCIGGTIRTIDNLVLHVKLSQPGLVLLTSDLLLA